MVQIPQDEKGKTSFKLPAFKVPKNEMLRGRRLQVRATSQSLYTLATLLGTASLYSVFVPAQVCLINGPLCIKLSRQSGILKVILIVHVSIICSRPQCPEEVAHLQRGSSLGFIASRVGAENLSLFSCDEEKRSPDDSFSFTQESI